MRARRLAYKEKMLLKKQAAVTGKNYNVMKNVSTHSIINGKDGEKYFMLIHPLEFVSFHLVLSKFTENVH